MSLIFGRGSWGSPDPLRFLDSGACLTCFSCKVTGVVDILNNFEQNLTQCFFCFREINLWEYFLITFFIHQSHYIFGGNTDRGVIPPHQFVPNISSNIEGSFIILLPSCLSRQDASKYKAHSNRLVQALPF